MSEPFLGEIKIFPYTFSPRGFAYCGGALVSIAQNSALYALLGVQYGGDGRTTFGIPDMRGRVVLGVGDGPGLTPPAPGIYGRCGKSYINYSVFT